MTKVEAEAKLPVTGCINKVMNNPRKYGSKPYNVAIIHGGPGAPGEMTPLAQELSGDFGIIEPLQTAKKMWTLSMERKECA